MRSAHGIRKDRPCACRLSGCHAGLCYVVVDAIKRAVPIPKITKREIETVAYILRNGVKIPAVTALRRPCAQALRISPRFSLTVWCKY